MTSRMCNLYKITTKNTTRKYAIVASSFDELSQKAKKKLSIEDEAKVIVQLDDGTEIDEESLTCIQNPNETVLSISLESEIIEEDERRKAMAGEMTETSSNSVGELVTLLKETDLTKNLKALKAMQRELDHIKIENGYTFLGEIACKIIDESATSRTNLKENSTRSQPTAKDNTPKCQTNTKKRKSDNLVPTPDQRCDFIDSDDLKHHKSPPTYEVFNNFLINARETRHGIHALKRMDVMEVKSTYDALQACMRRRESDEPIIVDKLEKRAKLLNPDAKCPSFAEVNYMKPYF